MNNRGRKKNPRIARAVRINEVMLAVLNGENQEDLAAKYNVSTRQIRADITEAMDRLNASTLRSTEDYRNLQLARHEMYLQKINKEWKDAIDNAAPAATIALYANTGLKVLDQENKLLALYTTKVDIKQETTHQFVLPVDQAADMMALIESQGLLQLPGTTEAEYHEVTEDETEEAIAETSSFNGQ